MHERICIFLRLDCAAFEVSNKLMMSQPIRPAESVKSLQLSPIQLMDSICMDCDMDKNFPPDVDQVLFPLVNSAICHMQ